MKEELKELPKHWCIKTINREVWEVLNKYSDNKINSSFIENQYFYFVGNLSEDIKKFEWNINKKPELNYGIYKDTKFTEISFEDFKRLILKEPRFKVGDKVRIVNNLAGSLNKIGDVGIITATIKEAWEEKDCYRITIIGRANYANFSYESDLELVTEENNTKMEQKKDNSPIKIDRKLVNIYYEAATDPQKEFIVSNFKVDGSTTVEAIRGLYEIACSVWKDKIKANHPEVFKEDKKWDRNEINDKYVYTLTGNGKEGIIVGEYPNRLATHSFATYIEAENEVFLLNTIVRMRNWAKVHNKIDGFEPDWSSGSSKWGIDVYDNKIDFDHYSTGRHHLFQIAVSSRERAQEMLTEFKEDIQKLIDLKMI